VIFSGRARKKRSLFGRRLPWPGPFLVHWLCCLRVVWPTSWHADEFIHSLIHVRYPLTKQTWRSSISISISISISHKVLNSGWETLLDITHIRAHRPYPNLLRGDRQLYNGVGLGLLPLELSTTSWLVGQSPPALNGDQDVKLSRASSAINRQPRRPSFPARSRCTRVRSLPVSLDGKTMSNSDPVLVVLFANKYDYLVIYSIILALASY
jgi:hypothetical protein